MAGRPHITGLVPAIHVVVCALVAGCGAQAPTAPARVSSATVTGPSDALASSLAERSASATVQARARTSHTLELLQGTFTLTLADGSAIWGTYRGTANVPSSGQPRARFEGTVTGGTGLFAGAKGSLRGTGTGGFAGDGEFSVALRAAVSTSDGASLDVRVALRGISTSTCTTTAPLHMALDGTGSARGMASTKGIASATGHLQHDLGTQVCAIIVE